MSGKRYASDLTDEVEVRRQRASLDLDPDRRAVLGQFFTPDVVARFLASLFEFTDAPAHLLDPGAGVGSLTAAVVARWAEAQRPSMRVTACELDESLLCDLAGTLHRCDLVPGVTTELLNADFIEWSTDRLAGLRLVDAPGFSHVVMNPPYRKLGSATPERGLLRHLGVNAPNLYAAFLALGARLLAPGGQLVAITPRSFANGPYFKAFRRDLLSHVALRHIHVYDARDAAFADSEVLQENVVFLAERRGERRPVLITASASPSAATGSSRLVPYDEVVRPDDPEQFIHLAPRVEQADVAAAVAALPNTLAALGVAVSTGRVVDFRARAYLRAEPADDTAPLVYPGHLREGSVTWPKAGKKPNALRQCSGTEPLLVPSGTYVLVKRFSSKEERRRVVASIVRNEDLPGSRWGFENHLNVMHSAGSGLDPALAAGLFVWLNSTPVDTAFRQFSGHTQVNATDLRNMHFPIREELVALGAAAGVGFPAQEKIDALVRQHISAFRI